MITSSAVQNGTMRGQCSAFTKGRIHRALLTRFGREAVRKERLIPLKKFSIAGFYVGRSVLLTIQRTSYTPAARPAYTEGMPGRKFDAVGDFGVTLQLKFRRQGENSFLEETRRDLGFWLGQGASVLDESCQKPIAFGRTLCFFVVEAADDEAAFAIPCLHEQGLVSA